MYQKKKKKKRYVVDIKNKHVLIIEIFPSQILRLLVLKEIKREYIYIYIYIFKIFRGRGKCINDS